MDGLRVQRGGTGDRLLLLLHGLGATGDVWRDWPPLLEAGGWRWVAPDLPGHGGSARLPGYSFATLAAAVAPLVERGEPVVVLGHSLGGVVGLALAGSVPVDAVIGLGIKVAWSAEELDRAQAMARRPAQAFGTRAEAAARHLRVSGLDGLVGPDDPMVDSGLSEQDGSWWLALDPLAFGVGAPDMPGLVAGSSGRVVLARGERDPMNTDEQLARLAERVTLPGLGHSAHVEDPGRTVSLLDRLR